MRVEKDGLVRPVFGSILNLVEDGSVGYSKRNIRG